MPFPAQLNIQSSRLAMRTVEEGDLPDLLAVNGDDAVTQYLPYASWQSLDDGRAWLVRMQKLAASGSSLQLVLVEKATGRRIGTCLLFRLDEGSARAELGYVLGRAHWGKGLMFEALSAVLAQAFSDGFVGSGALRRLEAEVNPANTASCRLLERLGFQPEGLLRQRWHVKGLVYDTRFYGLLRDEARGAAAP
ncbi:MAG: hypothetical protein AD742_05835 [Methylibium sp. NZG]|nr:MAG: hypothetical protein AD742_05835 [Methylibium sp. NZG]